MRGGRPKLAFVHDLPVGGAKRNFSKLIPLLGESFDVHVFEFDRPDRATFEIACGDENRRHVSPAPSLSARRLRRLPVVGEILLDIYLRRFYRGIAETINRDDFDAALVTQSRITNTPPLLGQVFVPVVYGCHEPDRHLHEPYQFRSESSARRWIRRFVGLLGHWYARLREARLFAKAPIIVANSRYSAEVFYRLFERSSVVAYPGVDTNFFKPRSAPPANRVLSVGSLDVIKGHDIVIESLALVPSELRPMLLIVCPHGTHSVEEETFLRSLARRNAVQVEITSGISDDELSELYATSLATIFCPRLEPFGLVCVEAMASGCPVLTVAEGGPRETVIDGETGFLLPRDPAAFAIALRAIITEPNLRTRLGGNAARHVREKFTWANQAEAVTVAISTLLEKHAEGLPG